MYKYLLSILFIGLTSTYIHSQLTFTDATSDLNDTTLKSGVAMGISDMNNDGLDDIIRFDGADDLRIEYQQADGTFVKLAIGDVFSGGTWGLTIADVDKNGFNDIIAGGAYNTLKLFLANADGTSYSNSNLSAPSIFLQNANFADIDNDGNIDFFGCHDDGISSPYRNDGLGAFTYDLGLINAESTVPSDNSGNYGSIWTDYDSDGDLDLYISKCRLGVSDSGDGRRRNLLFQNDGNNNFTDVAPAANLLPLAQSWAANFEDIDNDGDFDVVIINHDITSQIYTNDGDGTFTDITATSGIASELATGLGLGIQVMMEDFDNDTYIDIFMTTRSGDHYIFMNDGDNTFTTATSPFPMGTVRIQSGAVGDLNNDGFIDILAGHATGFNNPSATNSDQLFINDGNSNNWFKMKLNGALSNKDGIGAKVQLTGAWGTQLREVRAGESYGTQNSFVSHFGIADATTITEARITWPSGIIDVISNPTINTMMTVVEGQFASCPNMTTWNGTSWDNGEPNLNTAAIIDGDYTVSDSEDPVFTACSLTVNTGQTLQINAAQYVYIASDILVNGDLDIQDKGSIVQLKNSATVTNNGSIVVRKTTPSLTETDFMIMGTPMSGETREGVFGSGRLVLNHLTGNFVPNGDVATEYPLAQNFADDNGNNWSVKTGLLNPGEGYLVRPQPDQTSSGVFNLDHTLGTLNNGTINFNVLYNGTQNGSPNMLANPYPSAIDIDKFISANAMISTVYFWEHITAPSSGYPGYAANNFDMGDISLYNAGSGGTASSNGGEIPERYVASGQGFAVKASAAGVAQFNNNMRVTGFNDKFRSLQNERDRIWLQVKNDYYGLASTMLVAFTERATEAFEPYYDSKRLATPVSLYSILDSDEELAIQGRNVLNEDDEIALGFSTQVAENQIYSISIRKLEGLNLGGSQIYLEDRELGITTPLQESDYSFTANSETITNRFFITFKENVLGTNDFSFDQSTLIVPNPAKDQITVQSNNSSINKNMRIFDLHGRLVMKYTLGNSSSEIVSISQLSAGIYLIQVDNTIIKLIKE